MTRVLFFLFALCPPLFAALPSVASAKDGKLNLLIITTDDMSCDSVGVYGCRLKGTTPNMDRLAAQSLRFNHAHVVVGNCMPSRNVMWSGKYPHNNRIEGFRAMEKQEKDYPVLGDLVKEAGYFTGIRHKVEHSTPYSPFPWDLVLGEKRDDVKNAASWGAAATRGIEAAKQAGKPFCLLLNIADPHKPFYAEGNKGQTIPDDNVPSKVFTPEEVPIPGFLHDDPVIRKELAHYYSSVRRADDAVGAILESLKTSGQEDHTVIVFLSDHGMPLPFAKTQLYHHSSRTPLMIRWPGITKAGAVDDEHMISTVDLLPTMLDMLQVTQPGGFDGKSFAAVLKGEKQPGRTMVFKEHNENAGGQNTPMRAVQTKDWLYVFSPWSNGTRVMSGATAGTSTCRQMRVLAKTNAQIAARIDLFDHRVPEEAYEVRYDPDALTNLIAKPENAAQVAMLEKALEDWMVKTNDPLLEVFRKRDDAAFRETFMKKLEAGQTNRKDRKAANNAMKTAGEQKALIELEIPKAVIAGQKAVVKLHHHFPAELGEKPVQVTLKNGKNVRIHRIEVKASGEGLKEVTFDIPADVSSVSFAGLVGKGIQDALQHLQSKVVPVKQP
ncbi:MAG: sulfatase [Prosthecobacter sp.]|jgi:N-sulfoglucosamine sulfohydrolase|uniref:sulfatase family protein n=1 Tax=Prosthecobacter sp. TaxID=1965333 RepID=UPI001A087B4B|nr:sulfatase [Prosthecobacter sp.]MBE2285191.1 sulfatase [Prosthecobacter sp.]